MPRNGIRVRLVQAQQVTPDSRIKFTGLDIFRQVGFVGTGILPLRAVTITTPRSESALAPTALPTPPVIAGTATRITSRSAERSTTTTRRATSARP
ncbi:hypothetical protein GFS60_02831 [Rhodococcus sp. WAY2]|nr:hypothetical protein GFS60_02831 [Rhodococcus sp. WAY2]